MKRFNAKRRFAGKLAVVLMFMMLILPAKLYFIKIALLLMLLVLLCPPQRIKGPTLIMWGALVFSTLFGSLVGFINGAAEPFYQLTVGVLWPTLSLIIVVPLLKTENDYNTLVKWLFYVHVFIVNYDLLFILSTFLGFPFVNLYPEVENPFTFYGTTSRLNFDDNTNVLTYTTPLFFLLWLSRYEFGVKRMLQSLLLVESFFLLVICGRRSLMLIFFISPLIVFFISRALPREVVKSNRIMVLFFALLAGGFVTYFYINEPELFEGYVNTFTKAFDSDEEATKFTQAKMLTNEFLNHPLFGTGIGSVYYEPARMLRTHRFELTYLLKLANCGLFGFFFYCIGVIGPFIYTFTVARRRKKILPLFISFSYALVLIADATNPVLSSFDLMFPLYISYALVNSLYTNSYDRDRNAKDGGSLCAI